MTSSAARPATNAVPEPRGRRSALVPGRRRPPRARVEARLRGSGILLLAGCVIWLLFLAARSGGDARPMIALLVAAAASYQAARWLSAYRAWLAPLLVAGAAAGLAGVRFATLLESPLPNPFGYSNAIGSFYMLASAAALLVVARVRGRAARAGAATAAASFALVPWLNGTTTAAVLVCLVPLALLARGGRAVRACVGIAAAAVSLTLVAAIVLGASYRPGERGGTLERAIDASLSERRPELWRDALVLVAAHPLTGVGPNRFPEESPTARRDPDTRWPHNEALHFAAEAGVPGFLFLVGFFAWGFARLRWGGRDTGAAIAALALGAVGVHANVDYVLHFPAVTVAAGAILGAGSFSSSRRRRPTAADRRPGIEPEMP